MPEFDRRTIVTAGSTLLTGSAFAAVGPGRTTGTEESDEEASETDAEFGAEPSDGWFAFRANTGSTRAVSAANEPDDPDGVAWRYDAVETRGGIAVGDERAYRHDGNGRIHALDPADGSLEWTSEDVGVDEAPNSAPVVVGDRVYVGGEALVALDAETGDVRWRQEFGGDDESVFQPEFAFGTIYVTAGDFSDRRLYAVDPADGSIGWERYTVDEIEDDDSRWSHDGIQAYSLAVTDDAVYATAGQLPERRHVVALEPETGETLWATQPEGYGLRARVAATENYVFVYDASAVFETRVVDAATGEFAGSLDGGGPAAVAGDVFVGSVGGDERELRATNLETADRRTTRWVRDEARAYGVPAVAGDTVVVGTVDHDGKEFLNGFDVETGREEWCLHLEDVPQLFDGHSSLRYDLAIDDGTIYLSDDDEQFAIR